VLKFKGENIMELDDRKKKILALVVENYIESAEPVGSKQIAEDGAGSSAAFGGSGRNAVCCNKSERSGE